MSYKPFPRLDAYPQTRNHDHHLQAAALCDLCDNLHQQVNTGTSLPFLCGQLRCENVSPVPSPPYTRKHLEELRPLLQTIDASCQQSDYNCQVEKRELQFLVDGLPSLTLHSYVCCSPGLSLVSAALLSHPLSLQRLQRDRVRHVQLLPAVDRVRQGDGRRRPGQVPGTITVTCFDVDLETWLLRCDCYLAFVWGYG